MNGVKRFLGAVTNSEATSPPSSSSALPANGVLPLQVKPGPNWPPSSSLPGSPTGGTGSPYASPKMSTQGLFVRKKSIPTVDDAQLPPSSAYAMSSPGAGPSSPRMNPSRIVTRKNVTSSQSSDTAHKRTSSRLNIRDDLLLSLLASDAVVDSREFEILSSEEVDELKREQLLLSSRLEAMQKKLALETKVRDAALSLSKVNASNRKMAKQTEEQLASASRRLETAQKEWWRVSEQANDINRRLLEHRAGVLSFSMRRLEKKATTPIPTGPEPTHHRNRDSGYETPNRSISLSPVLSATSIPFDGAHLFAGHADAVVPLTSRAPDPLIVRDLEDKLKAANDAVAAANRRQADLSRELEMVKLGKQEAETMMDIELQNAQDTILALEAELPKMEQLEADFEQLLEEKKKWEQARTEQNEEIQALRGRIQGLESASNLASVSNSDAERLQLAMDEQRRNWDKERESLEAQKMEATARLQHEFDKLKGEGDAALQDALRNYEQAKAQAQQLIAHHSIPAPSADHLPDTIAAIGQHIAQLLGTTTKLQTEITRLTSEGDAALQTSKKDYEQATVAAQQILARHSITPPSRNDHLPDIIAVIAQHIVDSTSKGELERLQAESDAALQKVWAELEEGTTILQQLIHQHNIPMFTRETTLKALLSSVGAHLANAGSKTELENLRRAVENEAAKNRALSLDVEEIRRQREEALKECHILSERAQELQFDFSSVEVSVAPSKMFPTAFTGESAKIVDVLRPLWAMLPSPEARAAKFNGQKFRTGSSPTPPSPGGIGGSRSLSDLDVRSLKTLYGPNGSSSVATTPVTPNSAAFTVEGFAARVKALVIDDRSIIERLIRFAQAHDTLRKTADRAQKLAQEGSTALETYQKQVRNLEERNMSLSQRYAALEEHVQDLRDSVDKITAEKLEIETQAAEQAETCAQLTEANNTLSARTLTLAEEAASAPEAIKKQLEAQLAESKAALKDAQEHLEIIATSEQAQKAALLDELNSMQTDNANLRAQLRAMKK